MEAVTDIMIVRHAPAAHGGRLAGRRDVGCEPFDRAASSARLAPLLEGLRPVCSPARRCVETAEAIWGMAPETDTRLWEQDMGDWEGLPFADLPDLGPLGPPALAAHRPPGGESFQDLCARTVPALREMTGCAIVAHAGTVRAALSMAVGPAALSFEVAPLSVTHLRLLGRGVSVVKVAA